MDDANILVVEDDPAAAKLLEDTLKQAGYKVWVVDQPQRGLDLARQTPFAVVVTELRGAMNGVEVTRAMSRISPETNVVVATASGFIGSAVEAMEAGAYGYLTKPFNAAEVRMVVTRAVERFSLLSASSEKRQYAELSVKDGLTGLFNHRYFKLMLSQKLNLVASDAARFSLLMVDLDNFKRYNDTNGHLAGNELLRKLSQVLTEAVRQGDLVFRYGGEEFVVLLDHTDKPGARLVAQRLLTLVQLYTSATVSIGVSTCPDDGTEPEALVGRADAALYQAKEGGKNQVCVA